MGRTIAIIILVFGALYALFYDSPELFNGFKDKVDAQAYQRKQVMDYFDPNQKQGLGD